MREPRVGRKTETRAEFDALGRPVVAIEGNGAFVTLLDYDESGNLLVSQPPDVGPSRYHYDSRGIMFREDLPGGVSIRRLHDELGNLRQYIDEEGGALHTTHYDTDGLGRLFRIRYPDGTNEETRFENGTGVVLATRDRAKQWICYRYDVEGGRLLEEYLGGTGDEPLYAASPGADVLWARYRYDHAGRLTRVAGADSAVEYDGFDMLGRPSNTRSVRYRKTGCIPSARPCGSGFTTGEVAEVHTQGHVWSVFDGERTRWRMPAAGAALPEIEPDSLWRNWIEETRDASGTILAMSESLNRTGTAVSAIASSVNRGGGGLVSRERVLQLGSAATKYGYSELVDGGAAVAMLPPVAGPPTGRLARAETSVGTRMLAGTESAVNGKNLTARASDLAFANRESEWTYDERSRHRLALLLAERSSEATVPRVSLETRPAGLVESEIASSYLSSASLATARVQGDPGERTGWRAREIGAGNQMLRRELLHGPNAVGEESFQFSGGRRIAGGEWKLTFDARGRVLARENAAAGRRILYDYDPNARMVGRVAEQKNPDGAWTLETRTNVLARDGLPASTTWVWDPITDRLLAVYQAGAAQSSPEAGLIRQYLHGDQGYDDPVDVLIAARSGEAPQRFLPVVDEAATGSVIAVLDESGNLAERVLYGDAYGDSPRYLHGAVVEQISMANRAGAREISVSFSEPVVAATIAGGVRLTASDSTGTVLRAFTAAPTQAGDRNVRWSLDSTSWDALTVGSASIEISVSSALRFEGWGAASLQRSATWEIATGRVDESTEPFRKRFSISFASEQHTSGAASQPQGATLYSVPDLYLVTRPESRTKLHFDFHALPFREPADGMIFARARWYDPSTAAFVSFDPMGYADSSNGYAFAGNDPINMRDPSGAIVNNLIGGAVSAGLGLTIAQFTGTKYTWTDAAVDFTIGAASSGLSAVTKFGALGKAGLWTLRQSMEAGVDIAGESIRHSIKGEDFTLGEAAVGAAKNWGIGKAGALVGKGAKAVAKLRRKSSDVVEAAGEIAEATQPKPLGSIASSSTVGVDAVPSPGINPALQERLAAYKVWKEGAGIQNAPTTAQFRRFVGARRPGSRGSTLYEANTSGYARWIRGVEADSRTHFLYQKVGAKGEHMKFGITYDLYGRYSPAELGGGRLRQLAHGPKSEMLRLERSLHSSLPLGHEEGQLFYRLVQQAKGLQP